MKVAVGRDSNSSSLPTTSIPAASIVSTPAGAISPSKVPPSVSLDLTSLLSPHQGVSYSALHRRDIVTSPKKDPCNTITAVSSGNRPAISAAFSPTKDQLRSPPPSASSTASKIKPTAAATLGYSVTGNSAKSQRKPLRRTRSNLSISLSTAEYDNETSPSPSLIPRISTTTHRFPFSPSTGCTSNSRTAPSPTGNITASTAKLPSALSPTNRSAAKTPVGTKRITPKPCRLDLAADCNDVNFSTPSPSLIPRLNVSASNGSLTSSTSPPSSVGKGTASLPKPKLSTALTHKSPLGRSRRASATTNSSATTRVTKKRPARCGTSSTKRSSASSIMATSSAAGEYQRLMASKKTATAAAAATAAASASSDNNIGASISNTGPTDGRRRKAAAPENIIDASNSRSMASSYLNSGLGSSGNGATRSRSKSGVVVIGNNNNSTGNSGAGASNGSIVDRIYLTKPVATKIEGNDNGVNLSSPATSYLNTSVYHQQPTLGALPSASNGSSHRDFLPITTAKPSIESRRMTTTAAFGSGKRVPPTSTATTVAGSTSAGTNTTTDKITRRVSQVPVLSSACGAGATGGTAATQRRYNPNLKTITTSVSAGSSGNSGTKMSNISYNVNTSGPRTVHAKLEPAVPTVSAAVSSSAPSSNAAATTTASSAAVARTRSTSTRPLQQPPLPPKPTRSAATSTTGGANKTSLTSGSSSYGGRRISESLSGGHSTLNSANSSSNGSSSGYISSSSRRSSMVLASDQRPKYTVVGSTLLGGDGRRLSGIIRPPQPPPKPSVGSHAVSGAVRSGSGISGRVSTASINNGGNSGGGGSNSKAQSRASSIPQQQGSRPPTSTTTTSILTTAPTTRPGVATKVHAQLVSGDSNAINSSGSKPEALSTVATELGQEFGKKLSLVQQPPSSRISIQLASNANSGGTATTVAGGVTARPTATAAVPANSGGSGMSGTNGGIVLTSDKLAATGGYRRQRQQQQQQQQQQQPPPVPIQTHPMMTMAMTGQLQPKQQQQQQVHIHFPTTSGASVPASKMTSATMSVQAANQAANKDLSIVPPSANPTTAAAAAAATSPLSPTASIQQFPARHGGVPVCSPKPPQSPQQVLRTHGNLLTTFERGEIVEYPHIYFVGQPKSKPMLNGNPPDLRSRGNFGFDDERGDYLVRLHDHLLYRYEMMALLGKGSFGQVLRALDHKTGETYAIKIIRNRKRFHHQALVEVKLLECLRRWDADNSHFLLQMTDHFYFRNHLCIVTELLSINLYEWLKANQFAGTPNILLRHFSIQLIKALQLMASHRIIHCDLKPENILLKHRPPQVVDKHRKGGGQQQQQQQQQQHPLSQPQLIKDIERGLYTIKVIDFGSSCFENERVYTYIQSRFYRSPEVILGHPYATGIDMWSFGCIVAELLTGFPLFPGENEKEQLACIMEVLGPPPAYLLDRAPRRGEFVEDARKVHPNAMNGVARIGNWVVRPYVNSKGKRLKVGTRPLTQVLARARDPRLVDFVTRTLAWDPAMRMTPAEAGRHPWITDAPVGMRPQQSQQQQQQQQVFMHPPPSAGYQQSLPYAYHQQQQQQQQQQ